MNKRDLKNKLAEQLKLEIDGKEVDIVFAKIHEEINEQLKQEVFKSTMFKIFTCSVGNHRMTVSNYYKGLCIGEHTLCNECEKMYRLQHEISGAECTFEDFLESQLVMEELTDE